MFGICINNNAKTNNNRGNCEDPNLLLKIPIIDRRKDLLEIYRQFGHAFSNIFSSPGIGGYALIP
jgi:hypothetical protein